MPLYEEYDSTQEEDIASARNITRDTAAKGEIADEIEMEKDEDRQAIEMDKQMENAFNLLQSLGGKVNEFIDVLDNYSQSEIEIMIDHVKDIISDPGAEVDKKHYQLIVVMVNLIGGM